MTNPDLSAATARALWLRYELVHDLTYFSAPVLTRATELGLRGFWMGYFALRSAPLGQVDPAVVTATFFGFHPVRVQRALPDAWLYTTPEVALATRLAGVEEAMAQLGAWDGNLTEAAELLWAVAESADCAGRPLAAANQALPHPDSAAGTLWQATATLREHRGDGHIAALVAAGVTPAEAHQLKIAAGESGGDALRTGRGFPDDAWQAGTDALVDRGWLEPAGGLTQSGAEARAGIEAATDRAALQPWRTVGLDASQRALRLLDPLARAVAESGLIPWPNPVGLVWEPIDRSGG